MNAIILCGGKGERLRPLTLEIPKPMVPVKGHPILWYIVRQLVQHDIQEIFVTVGYKSSIIKDYFKENFKDLNITIVDDGDVDIIKRIKSVVKLAPNDDVLLMYGDTISDVDLGKLFAFSEENRKLGTLTVWPLTTNFGLVDLNERMEIIGFQEKPKLDKWINIGYFIIRRELFNYLDDFDKFEDFLKFSGSNALLNAYKHEGEHFTINTLVELEHVEQNIDNLLNF